MQITTDPNNVESRMSFLQMAESCSKSSGNLHNTEVATPFAFEFGCDPGTRDSRRQRCAVRSLGDSVAAQGTGASNRAAARKLTTWQYARKRIRAVSSKRRNIWLLITRVLTTLMSLALAFSASGWSQQPIPVPSETCQNEQRQTAGPNQPIGEKKKTSQPPSIIVNVLPHQETETEKSRKRKERDEKSSGEQWSIESTIAIAFFTGVLALSTILLWLDIRKSSKTATKPANAAEKAGDATAELERHPEP